MNAQLVSMAQNYGGEVKDNGRAHGGRWEIPPGAYTLGIMENLEKQVKKMIHAHTVRLSCHGGGWVISVF
jgi:hypothetical protein